MSSVLDDLSGSMSQDEKKALLGKIQASLNLNVKDTDSIVSKVDGPDELKHRLTKEVSRLGLFERLLLRLTGFFRSRSVQELLKSRKLSGAREALRSAIPSFIHFSREELTAEFAKAIYDLYFEAVALKPVIEHLFQQKLTLEAGLLRLLEDEYSEAAHQLTDLYPMIDIEAHYRAEQKRSVLHLNLKKRLEAYLAAFPTSVLDRVKGKLKPLYYFKHLVSFPYAFLFDQFGHNPDKTEPNKYPYFLGAPWRKTAGFLERLYYGLYLTTKMDWQEGSLDPLFHGVADRMGESKTTWTVELMNQRMTSLTLAAGGLVRRIPWKELLQWTFQDPFYSVKFYLPQFSLKDFYQTTLEMRFIDQLDEILPQVRQKVLASERALLFQNTTSQPLDFYISGVGTSVGATHQLKGFSYPETLGLLWGFLNQHFLRKYVPFFQSMTRMVQQANKGLLQPLSNLSDDLVNLREKIARFDKTLHPDMDEGKEFQKLKYELAGKPTSYKPFIQLVQNKDSQARELIERGLENLLALAGILSGLKDKNIPAIKNVLSMPYLLEGQQETIGNGLDRILVITQKTIFILREALTLEG